MGKALRSLVVYGGLAIATTAIGIAGVKEYCDGYRSYHKIIQGTIMNERRTPEGGYFIKIKTPDGIEYKTGQSEEGHITRMTLGMSLDELDEIINVGDGVKVKVRTPGTNCEKPGFSDNNTC
jgi:hypothetical protein